MKPTGKLKFAYDSISNLEQKISRLEYENDELKSKLDELYMAATEVCVYLNEGMYNSIGSNSALHTQLEFVLNQTPQQSLNEIKAQAIEEGVKECMGTNDDVMVKAKANQMTHYANKLRGEK